VITRDLEQDETDCGGGPELAKTPRALSAMSSMVAGSTSPNFGIGLINIYGQSQSQVQRIHGSLIHLSNFGIDLMNAPDTGAKLS